MRPEHDIFISYAHDDNESLSDGSGWVTSFHKKLETRLKQLIGQKPKIWRDPKIQGNDYFGDVITEEIPKAELLVSILTPRYVHSEWCRRELHQFYLACGGESGVRKGTKSRIIKVLKTPVKEHEQPLDLQGMRGYEFYDFKQDGKFREYDTIFGEEYERKFFDRLEDIAQDMCSYYLETQPRSSNEGQESPAVETIAGKTIYLAEVTRDMCDERDRIRRELQLGGNIVLPDSPLPHSSPEYEQAVARALSSSELSIHLIGASYGMILEGQSKSIVVLQQGLAAHQAKVNSKFSYLVWMPQGLKSKELPQNQFIEELHNDANVLQVPLEEFKTLIQEKLLDSSQPESLDDTSTSKNTQSIYLICDQKDLEDENGVGPIVNYLFDQGFDVVTPIFDDDEAKVRQDHQSYLCSSEAVLIYYGHANERWVRTKLGDLQKSAGYGRTSSFKAKAVYVGLPHCPQKKIYRTHDALVLHAEELFNPASLNLFMAQLAVDSGR
jgi:hypothetical protein